MHKWIFPGKELKVPYITQINENACGAAVLEMVYRYYGLENISQEEFFRQYQELEPHGSGNFLLSTDNLVLDARKRGLLSFWGRADYTNLENSISLLTLLTKALHVPVIVCQKFTEKQPQIGHFRVVLSANQNTVSLHDPDKNIGGAYQKWEAQKFMEFWQPTGQNVTGGIFVVIKK